MPACAGERSARRCSTRRTSSDRWPLRLRCSLSPVCNGRGRRFVRVLQISRQPQKRAQHRDFSNDGITAVRRIRNTYPSHAAADLLAVGLIPGMEPMQRGTETRFDAEKVERLTTANDTARLEMQFTDAEGKKHVVSLPLSAALALGRLICDVAEQAPYLIGGRQPKAKRK